MINDFSLPVQDILIKEFNLEIKFACFTYSG